jgi:hypothetical protein
MKVKEHFANSNHNILVWQLIFRTVMEKTTQVRRNCREANYDVMHKWLQDRD